MTYHNDVLDLTLGQVSGPPPEGTGRAVSEALATATTWQYAPPAGLPSCRRAVARWLKTEPARVSVTAGASGAFLGLLLSLMESHDLRGRGLLMPDPCYPGYRGLCRRLGIRVESYRLTNDGKRVDMESFAEALRTDPCAVLIVNPGNPIGVELAPDSVRAVWQEVERKNDVLVIEDETYRDLVTPGCPLERRDNAITLVSFSKSFALAGLRIGALSGPEDVVRAASAGHFSAVMSASIAAQVAVTHVLSDNPLRYLSGVRRRLTERHDTAVQLLSLIEGVHVYRDEVGVFCYMETPLESGELVRRLGDMGVLVVDGRAFGPYSGRHSIRAWADVSEGDMMRFTHALETALGVRRCE